MFALSSNSPRGAERWKWEFRSLSTVDLLNLEAAETGDNNEAAAIKVRALSTSLLKRVSLIQGC